MKSLRRSQLAFVLLSLLPAGALRAATPPGGGVSETSPAIAWSGGIMPANPDLLNSPRCAGANASKCDNFALTVTPPAASFGRYVVEISLVPQGDWDVEVYGPDGSYLKGSGNGTGAQEFVLLDAPAAGTYRIAAFPFSPAVDTSGTSYAASAALKHKAPSAPASGTENVAYATFPCPATETCTTAFGEPSIGVNWKTGAVMFAGGGTLKTYRVTNFNDAAVPPTATWTNVGINQHIATSPRAYADPILFTDPRAGRTFAGQLEGLTPFCTTEYTDDDGATWIPSQGSGIAAGIDHETYGGGPFAAPLTRDPSIPRPAYPNSVYYCAQSSAGPAQCAISLDGGQTFGPSVPMWTTQCGGLHGHIKIAPDGTAYVPNRSCTGRQGFAVSSDNGATWDIRTVPGSAGGDSDPSIGIGADGTVYLGFSDGDGHPKIAVTHDKGLTWDHYANGESFTDVGTPFGIQNSVFPAVVAGDANRAAFAFHGTPAAGPFQDASFAGVWDLYVAQTFDGGKTWTTVKASPDPVQRGCIWLGGGSNPCRNLLDFFDAAIDEAGRVVVGYADGCTGSCATNPASTTKSVWATIARQSVGKRMFAQFDPPESTSPGSLQFSSATYSTSEGGGTATITVDRVGGTVGPVGVSYATSNGTATAGSDYTSAGGTLSWADGDASSKTFTVTVLDDAATEPSETVNLALSAPTGGATLGAASSAVLTIIDNEAQSGCTLPGAQVQSDASGDQLGGPNANTQLDLRSVFVAEPYSSDAEHSLTFTVKVANLTGVLQPNSSWSVYFNAPDTSGTSRQLFVQMNTTDVPAQASFSYGWHDAVNNVDVGQCFANSCPQVSGGYTSDGTITIKLITTNALSFGDAATGAHVFDANLSGAGTALSSIAGATSTLAGAAGTGLIVPVDDSDGGGSYTVGGNLSCKPNGGTDPACALPGTTVTTDPAGDQTGAAQLDVQSLQIAEPYTTDSDKSVTFTLKVANLSAPIPPNAMWRVSFTANDTTGTPRALFLQMDTTGSQNLDPTTPEFDYGYTGTSNTTQGNPGGAVTGSYTAAGAIVMKVKAQTTLSFSDVTGAHQFDVSLNPGMVLSNVAIASQTLVGAIGNGAVATTDASTNNGGPKTYTLRGNLSCKPTNPVTHYGVAAPSSAAGGSAINVTVTALDAANAAVSGYRGTAHFTSSDGAAVLPADYAFTAADAGAHTFSVTLNTAGAQTVTATDTAASSITGAASVAVTTTKTPTTTSLASSPNPSTSGQAVTFTATVTPSAAAGTVTFKDGAAAIGSGTLSGGTATFTTSSLSSGAHSMTAVYSGNATYAASASAAITQTVNQSLAGTPRFDILTAPSSLGDGWGEPSIGVNWQSERVFSNSAGPVGNGGTLMSFGGFGGGASITNLGAAALRITCSDCPSPADAVWEKSAMLLAAGSPRVYGDPILFTDHDTGRTFISQLLGLTPLQSGTDLTDDDGKTIIPTVPSGIPSGVDHETIGGGPYHAPLPQGVVYKNAVYYCSQDLLNAVPANCSLSLDGGLTWGPAVPTASATGTQCGGGIHGHVKVGPDGTVYVPHRFCNATGTTQGLAISSTNGVTWTSSSIPGTSDGNWDPSVGIGKDGAIYFGMDDHDRHPRIATSHDGGQTWSTPVDVGAPFHIERTAFPAVVAGDAGRAAFAFLGTPAEGDDQSPAYNGEWHLYLATTFDGGQNWSTSDLTPNDPVQRGAICASGPSCTAQLRNLLDFFDATIDKEGRVVIGFADGCITPQCISGGPNDATAKNAIARQSGGKRMFAAFDPVEPSVPKAPKVSAVLAANANHVFWSTPDHSGSPVTSFKLYRRVGTGPFNLLAVSSGNHYDDNGIAAGTSYAYRVTAVNSIGEGPYCGEAAPVVPADSCHEPGILAVNDVNTDGSDNDSGQNTAPDPRVNIQGLYVAEPDLGGAQALVFTLYVKPSPVNVVPPSTQWFIIWNKIVPELGFDRWYVAMKSDAAGALSFEYGKVSSSGQITDPNINTPTRLGDADGGSYDPLTGKIRIVLSRSKAENIAPGQSLTGLNVRTFYIHPDAGPRSQAASSDITDNGSYTLAGNCTANHAPVASGDAYAAAEDTPLSVAAPGVLANDTDADGNALTATLVSGPAHGTLSLASNGAFTYTPVANYNGPDSFTYKANDGTADSNVATVSIAVAAVNDAPSASNDSYTTAEDTALSVAAPGVLGNDSDVDGDALTAVLVGGPAHGSLTLNANGSFSYTPAANYNGADSFTYKANDGSAGSNVATVTIVVTAVNDPPVAVNDAYAVKPNATLTVPAPGVLANDGDVDSPSLTAVLVSGVSHGTLTLNADGSFVYTPATAYKGTDSFTYKANDGAANSNVATVTITVTTNAARAARVTGAGEVQVNNPDGIANFGFNIKRDLADGTPSGQLDYFNSATGMSVKSVSITSLNISGTSATISGTCTKNGAACTFTATVEDNGEPGGGTDRFSIAVSGEPVQGGGAPITSGNVQIH
ncbi:MAG TPA: Ig-like domain-containing protein [Thermoanaerobaculia bacterium]|jgi:VCBS repeat-containing protein